MIRPTLKQKRSFHYLACSKEVFVMVASPAQIAFTAACTAHHLTPPLTNRVKAQLIDQLRADYPLQDLLAAAQIASSSYYDARHRQYRQDDPALIDEIAFYHEHYPDMGYRRVTTELQRLGWDINHKRVLRIMQEHAWQCTLYRHPGRGYRFDSFEGHTGQIAPNRLHRRFKTDRPLQKIVTDISEFRWGHESIEERAFLAICLDLFNMEIVTWQLAPVVTVTLALSPVQELITYRPALPYRMTVHSDRGYQYQHARFVTYLRRHHVFQSMSRQGNCLDNAPVESCFAQLKVLTVNNHRYPDYATLKAALQHSIDYYNFRASKQALGKLAAVEYRQRWAIDHNFLQFAGFTPLTNATNRKSPVV